MTVHVVVDYNGLILKADDELPEVLLLYAQIQYNFLTSYQKIIDKAINDALIYGQGNIIVSMDEANECTIMNYES